MDTIKEKALTNTIKYKYFIPAILCMFGLSILYARVAYMGSFPINAPRYVPSATDEHDIIEYIGENFLLLIHDFSLKLLVLLSFFGFFIDTFKSIIKNHTFFVYTTIGHFKHLAILLFICWISSFFNFSLVVKTGGLIHYITVPFADPKVEFASTAFRTITCVADHILLVNDVLSGACSRL